MFRVQDFTMAASAGARTLNVRCKQIRLLSLLFNGGQSTTGVLYVGLPNGGGEVPLMVGQGIELPEEISSFTVRGEIYPSTYSGRLLVGSGNFLDSRLFGTVQTVDGEREKVMQGVCFRGIASVAGGGAAGAIAQLHNGTTNRNVFVTGIRLGATAADSWSYYSTTTQAPTLIGPGVNMDRAAGGSLASIRSGNDATVYAGIQNLAIGYMSASQDVQIPLDKPIWLRAGACLNVQTTSLATAPRVTFEWEEWVNF